MSRVLISFLGTGSADANRQYRTAEYRFPESGKEYKTSFVAAAIHKEYCVDRMILIGTMHSMWDAVYEYFARDNGFDEDVWLNIAQQCGDARHFTPIGEIAHQDQIEQVLGEGSKIVPIHYGLNQQEIENNASIILGLDQYLNEGDELIVDITHSFRSLPLYIMNLLVYLKDVSDKRLKIKHICYGMLDVAKELEHTPIIELKDVVQVNEWISGAYSFKRFGNADKIVELVKPISDKLSNDLKDFSETKNLNHLAELERQSRKLADLLAAVELPPMARTLIPPVLEDFVKRLTVDSNDPYRHSKFQSKLARWQFNNKNYLAAYISLNEAIITYLAEQYKDQYIPDIDVFDKDEREAVKERIRSRDNTIISNEWRKLSEEVSYKRNALAHNLPRDGRKKSKGEAVASDFVKSLQEFLGRYDKCCKS